MTPIKEPLHEYSNKQVKRILNFIKQTRRNSLSVLKQDETGSHVIALDEEERKLLYANNTPGINTCLIADLNELEKFTVKKEYQSINAGDLVKKKLHQFIKRINIQLVFKNRTGIISLPVFDAKQDQKKNPERLEIVVSKWETIIRKLLKQQAGDSKIGAPA